MRQKRFGRTLLLNSAADKLGFDKTTRRAMTHVELFIGELAKRNLTWDDVPEKFGVQDMMPGFLGRITLGFARRDEGFQTFEQAVNDPALRPGLLNAYVQCIEVATPGETATIASTIRYLREQGG